MFIPIYKIKLVPDGQIYSRQELKYDETLRNILPFIQKYLAGATQEHHITMTFNAEYSMTGVTTTGLGTLTSVSFHPREVFKPAVAGNAYAIICCHSHPGNNANPSDHDKMVHETLVKAANIMGIMLLDNVIVAADGSYFSHTQDERHKSHGKHKNQHDLLKHKLQRKIEKGSASRRDIVRLAGKRLADVLSMVRAEAADELKAIILDIKPITKTPLRIRRDVRQRAKELLKLAQRMLKANKKGEFIGPSELEELLGNEPEDSPKSPEFDVIVLSKL
jgi:DNA repair protein RadC